MSAEIDTKSGLIAWFARNSVAANLLMVAIIVGGIFGIFRVQKQVLPQFIINNISVQVPYLGAAPQEVEEGVIVKIEEAIKDLEGIKQITSTAREGLGSVSIQVEDGYDVQNLLDEVKVQVDAIPSFPANTEKPVVYRVKLPQDVLWISVFGDANERQLKETAKSIRDDIANLSGVSDVSVIGTRDYEVSVEISENDLQAFNLTFDEVVNAIRASSIDVPGGAIKGENGDILLRAKGQAYSAWEYARIPLINRQDGTRLLLGDIASINDGFVEESQFSVFDGKKASTVRVRSVGDQNSLQISKVVNQYLETKRAELPPNISAQSWGDSTYYLNERLNMMIENMVFGALLVFLVLSLFLRIKLALWVILGLPVCFLGTIMLMPLEYINVTINQLSLFGFILVLGIVVDDAIIMGESAYSEIDKKGAGLDNIIRGVKRVAMPATFGVLTTIAAFVPMLMVTGTFGIIWKTIGMVVILCLVFSLIESKLILPAHLANMKVKPYRAETANWFQRKREGFHNGVKVFIHEKYAPFLIKALKYRYTTLVSFIAMLILIGGLVIGGFVRFVFFPDIPSDFIAANFEMEAGSSIAQRDATISAIMKAAVDMNNEVAEETGQGAVKHYLAFDQGALAGRVFIELTKSEDRDIDGKQIQLRWRDKVPEIAGMRSLTIAGLFGPGNPADFEFEFSSSSIQDLAKVSAELRSYLGTYSGITEINDTFSGGSDEIRLEVKPQAEALGISLSQLAQQVRFGFYGAEAQRIQRGDEEVKVMVRYPKEQRSSLGNLENMRVRAPNGDDIPFSQVADIELSKGYSSIVRVDGFRSISVSGQVNKELIDPGEIVAEVSKNIIPEILTRYPGVTFELQGSSREQGEAVVALAQGFLLAILAIFALMAIPLRSYSQPLIIMSVIPFGLVGAIVGHIIIGMPINILSILGIIALAGVVVNDSLIMVDFVNRARREGYALVDAVINAGTQRFRAIILTSLTTFMGLLPIIFEKSLQAQFIIPMATSLAFGILFATVITLLLVPALYLILDDFKGLFRSDKKSSNIEHESVKEIKLASE